MKVLNYLPLAALVILPFLPSCGGSSGGGAAATLSPPPVVSLVTPVDGATDVPLDSDVIIEFSQLMQKGSVNRLTLLVIERGGAGVLGTITFIHVFNGSRPGLEATFHPAIPLLPCTTYDVVASSSAKDLFNRSLTPFASSFTTIGTNCAPPPPPPGPCVPPIPYGTASTYAVLAGSTITNTGPTILNGDLGLNPGTSVTGSPVVTGVTHIADAPALQAQNDLITAYNAAAAAPSTATFVGDIGGMVLTAGVYTSSSALSVQVADLTLSGGPNDVFIFQTVSTLTIGSGRRVILLGVRPCNVIWQVGSSAVLNTGAQFAGTILALTDITLLTGATADGALLARNGQVILDTNVVSGP